MNDRPITQILSKSGNLSALTLNNIILLRRNPCVSSKGNRNPDRYQAKWKQVNHLADQFLNVGKRVSKSTRRKPKVVENQVGFSSWRSCFGH